MAEKKCYTIRELQDMLGVSRQTLYVLLKKNYFHSVRIGGKYLVSKKSFDSWFDGGLENVEDSGW